jgi:hypothetical protein
MLARAVSRPVVRAPLLAAVVLGSGGAYAQTVDASQVPTVVDSVERGLRLRLDLWGREAAIGNPAPPVALIVPDVVNEKNDTDVGGMVILGWDRPFGVPLAADLMGDTQYDIGGDSPVSPFLDDTSVAPRVHLYSAFIGISGAPGEALEPFKLNIGRMTQIAESPITYDGLSGGVKWKLPKLGYVNAIVWGGIDAPQHLATDPFSRVDAKASAEQYQDLSGFVSPTGGKEIVRTPLDFNADGAVDPNINPVGGLNVDGKIAGIGFTLSHTLMPSLGSIAGLPLERTILGGSYGMDSDALSFIAGADVRASDFLPRNVNAFGDVLTGDGTTRVGARVTYQFLEDICTYDCSFRAFNPATSIDQVPNGVDANGKQQVATNDVVEAIRVHDQIRHLNIGPEEPHIAVVADAERGLGGGFTGLLRARLRQHFDDKQLDYFRTNVYEAGVGATWSTGLAFEAGDEVYGGFINSGTAVNKGIDFTLVQEGITSYVENRFYVRTVLVEGKLSNLAEVFVRREDIQTKALVASGQWGGAFADTLRYDVLDFWSLSARVDADALSPIDTLNGSGYLAALVGTSVHF